MNQVIDFITNNQTLLVTVVLCVTYLANRFIDYMAAKPEEDIWDKVKPYSNVCCSIVFDGVEYLAKNKKMSSVAKSLEYADVLKKFAESWNQDKAKAVSELYSWYSSIKKKSEEITKDSVAVE